MKSELLLAINQICAERDLPREVVVDAIRTAIAEAYRKDVNAPKTQNITAQIDLDTGQARIFVERRVVAEVTDPRMEITLEEARKLNPRIQLGETIMVDSTPKDFGRIAAQAARQRIIQCIREAEREIRYSHFAQQAGEIVQGVVQSVTPQQVTLHIDRTEAILPQKEMIPGERYAIHDRIRVYILEVRRTPRGPEIIVSRSHKKLLQRLLELEIPEIASGAVEIKALVREAGSRSKVAVASRQPGVDPVGACVGMRSVRIQSILRELGNEKVDIIEWSPDPVTFIARALGPARVLSVVLDEEADGGRMAHVVVPDDQLSLAIGKAGQNARLAAKLTGWRIDIQNVTEAAQWALQKVREDPEVLAALETAVDHLVPQVEAALKRHAEEGGPYTAEEMLVIRQVVEKVRHHYIARRQEKRRQKTVAKVRLSRREQEEAARRAAFQEALARIPPRAYRIPVEDLGLSERTISHLQRHGMVNVGQLMERLAEGEEGLLKLDGIGVRVLNEIRSALDKLELPAAEPEVPAPGPAEAAPVAPEAQAVPEVPAMAEEVRPEAPGEEAAPAEVVAVPEEAVPEIGAGPAGVLAPEAVAPPEEAEPTPAVEGPPVEAAEVSPTPAPVLPEFEGELEEWEEEEEEEVVEKKLQRQPKKRKKKPLREYIYDEELGRAIAIRRRRRGDEWDDEF